MHGQLVLLAGVGLFVSGCSGCRSNEGPPKEVADSGASLGEAKLDVPLGEASTWVDSATPTTTDDGGPLLPEDMGHDDGLVDAVMDALESLDLPEDLAVPDVGVDDAGVDTWESPWKVGAPCSTKGERHCQAPSTQASATPAYVECDGPDGNLTWQDRKCAGVPYFKAGPCEDTLIDVACQEHEGLTMCCAHNKFLPSFGKQPHMGFCTKLGVSKCTSTSSQDTCVLGDHITDAVLAEQFPCYARTLGCYYTYINQCKFIGKNGWEGNCKPDPNPVGLPKCPGQP